MPCRKLQPSCCKSQLHAVSATEKSCSRCVSKLAWQADAAQTDKMDIDSVVLLDFDGLALYELDLQRLD